MQGYTGQDNSNVIAGRVFSILYEGKKILHLYVESLCHPVCPTPRHISAWKTGSVLGSRARQLPQLNGGDYVTWFRAKTFNSPWLCLLPLMDCCSPWQLVFKKITTAVSPPDQGLSELSPRKLHCTALVRARHCLLMPIIWCHVEQKMQLHQIPNSTNSQQIHI